MCNYMFKSYLLGFLLPQQWKSDKVLTKNPNFYKTSKVMSFKKCWLWLASQIYFWFNGGSCTLHSVVRYGNGRNSEKLVQ